MTPSSGMHISQVDFRNTSTGLSETGTVRLQDVRALRAYLEGEGDPWGDDEVGSVVGAAYHAVTRHALDIYESLAERHVTTGGDVELTAANHRSAEQRNEEEVDRIARAVHRP